ncbi:site-specific DNA-methyltransferase [Amedibacillus dolichus]|uniref:site-specific DNA-methyltransferase n=1 Tax=Amedibacillus dolichus TaxID=31971 RepID=UPI00399FBDF0
MEKINDSSLDLTKLNIEKLKELFPNVVTEGKIDFDVLRTVLGDEVDDSKEKYQFTWKGKNAAIKLAQTPSSATLRPDKESSKDWNTTENLYIEGDNLEVLKQLQKTYYGKIKMIYIDPPYNTGNDFVYKDDFKNSLLNYKEQTNQGMKSNPETSGRYHTDWLNMMYSRLLLAKNLLRDEGIIFISIDDNEKDNLKKICDELFGMNNFIGTFIINSAPNARDYGHIGKMHEFCLFYAKNIRNTETNMLPDVDKTFKYTDSIGGFNIHPLYNSNEAFNNLNRPNLYYPFYIYLDKCVGENFYEIGLDKKENSIEIYPPKSLKNNIQFVWRWGKEKASNNMNVEIIGYKTNDGEFRIVQKMRHSQKLIRSLLIDKKYSSRKGTAEVEDLFKAKYFSFPKPISLLTDFIQIGMDKNDIVLDFFSGSATTAHAVMKLNAEDGGNRKFIMVQLPELCDEKSEAFKAGYKNICEIGKERIRRAGEQIKSEWEEEHSSDTLLSDNEKFTTDIGFKVFKLASTNIQPWDNEVEMNEEDLFALSDVFKEGRSKEDILYEIMLKYGVFDMPATEVEVNGKTMYRVGKRYMIVCLEDEITSDDVNAIAELAPKTVVFKEAGFKNDNDKINAEYNLEKAGVEDIKCI